ncbi:MAG: zinc-binding dehydrogenase, partial [Hyphomicrobiaceae bacterium]
SGDLVVPIPPEHPKDLSCIVGCAVLTGAGAVLHTAKVRPGESVAVFGVGGVGLSAIRAASILEAYPIIAVDLDDEKLAFARSFGATHTVNASGNTDPVEAIRDLTGGGVDYAFDAIGRQRTCEQILQATRPGGVGAENFGGTAVLVGIPQEKITIDPALFTTGQRIYRGSLGASLPDQDFPMYLRWHKEGKFPLDKLITRRYGLDQINEACDHLHSGEILGRAILEY